MVTKVLPEIETLKAKLKRGEQGGTGCQHDMLSENIWFAVEGAE